MKNQTKRKAYESISLHYSKNYDKYTTKGKSVNFSFMLTNMSQKNGEAKLSLHFFKILR